MIKFLHAADFHLDAPFAALNRETARLRRQEQRSALQQLVEACNRAQCDLMLLSGDLFDGEHLFPETIACLQQAFSACRAQIFLAPGNHDFFSPGGVYDSVIWPDQVHIFTEARPQSVFLPQLDCTVWGAAFTSMDAPALLRDFSVPDPAHCNLMVLHGEVGNPNSCYDPILPAQIAASSLRYLALGHIHQASGLQRAGDTFYAWPGCLMGRGFDECGEKGYYLGTIQGADVSLQFVPLPGRRYQKLTLPAGDDPAAALDAALPASSGDIFQVTLCGEAAAPDLQRLQAQFAGRVFALTLLDRTTPKQTLWDGCGENTLRGLFLRELKAQYDAADSVQARQEIALAVRCGLAAMEGRETI